jgi:hypothetical protein
MEQPTEPASAPSALPQANPEPTSILVDSPSALETTTQPADKPVLVEKTVREKPAPTPPPVIHPLAVMVDNYTSARPQSGLGSAAIVYEALAEGGITRFLAIFTHEEAVEVGPVRSTRHYYVYWAAEYNAPLAHVMATNDAQVALARTGLLHLDEYRGDPGFRRSNERRPPFNTYTSPTSGREILASIQKLSPGDLGGIKQQPLDRLRRGARARTVHLSYPPGEHWVDWSYDPAQERYLRSQDGGPHLDASTGEQISAGSVVVLFVPTWVDDYEEGYLDMQLTGAGRALYFQGGLAQEGAWHRTRLRDSTEYYDASGQPFSFAPGPVWVQIVPSGALKASLTYEPGRDSAAGASSRSTRSARLNSSTRVKPDIDRG